MGKLKVNIFTFLGLLICFLAGFISGKEQQKRTIEMELIELGIERTKLEIKILKRNKND